MTAFNLKILAMVCMVIDHLGYWLYAQGSIGAQACTLMRSVGRIAFPVFAFLLVNGWLHSRDRGAYLRRLMLFALISQPAYVLVFTAANYAAASGALSFGLPQPIYIALCLALAALWYFFVRRDASALLAALCPFVGLCTLKLGGLYLLRPEMNVFYTLAISLAAMSLLDVIFSRREPDREFFGKCAAFLAAALLVGTKADYGINGIVLLVMLWLFRANRLQQLAMLLLWIIVQYLIPGDIFYSVGAALALLPLYLYNGKAGKSLKTVFYLVYPLHLSVLGLLLIRQACI